MSQIGLVTLGWHDSIFGSIVLKMEIYITSTVQRGKLSSVEILIIL